MRPALHRVLGVPGARRPVARGGRRQEAAALLVLELLEPVLLEPVLLEDAAAVLAFSPDPELLDPEEPESEELLEEPAVELVVEERLSVR